MMILMEFQIKLDAICLQYNIISAMWKKQSLLIEKDYPFGLVNNTEAQKYCAKKKLLRGEGHLEKTKILSTLKHDSLMKIEGVQQENGDYYLVYQYVPQSIQKWYTQVNRQYIQNYEQRLIMFSRFLTDKGIITSFKRQNMGVTETGQPKYYLETTFTYNLNIDKLPQKKKYKQQIRQLIQYYLDKNIASKMNVSKKIIPEKKQNSKILKILEAIEKGKADLCSDSSKEQSVALANNRNRMAEMKSSAGGKNFHNVFIQKQINHINKIQVIIGNNKPVQVIQEEFKRQYASSSFYLNGIQTAKFQKESEARRLLSPNDKYSKFEEVHYKEYKNMKASGEVYVQDFINVLQAEQNNKNVIPGSPRLTMSLLPRSTINAISQKIINEGAQKYMISNFTLEQEQPKEEAKVSQKQSGKKQNLVDSKHNISIIEDSMQILSERKIKLDEKQDIKARLKYSEDLKKESISMMISSVQIKQPSDIQKKVNQAIANSLSAINRIKNGKVSQVCN